MGSNGEEIPGQFEDADESAEDEMRFDEKLPAKESATNGRKRTREDEFPPSEGVIPAHAKARLSKWAARLFDPNRIRGIIETPQTIPLNDEFLSAFGKKERQLDEKKGVTLESEQEIEDVDDLTEVDVTKFNELETPKMERKVKITNIKYTTTESTLLANCSAFGPIEEVHLPQDRTDATRNAGRAFVLFTTAKGAQDCLNKLDYMDGRPVKVTVAAPSNKGSSSKSSATSRYFIDRDLSTKCFRCGGVGHMSSECKNREQVKPCSLCADTSHEMRNCPMRTVCHNCGVPGHTARNCNAKPMPARMRCTNCFQLHHRSECRPGDAPRAPDVEGAVCFTCGQKGHYSCMQPHFFYGLPEIFCSNCGRPGHIFEQCKGPRMDICSRNNVLLEAELVAATRAPSVEQHVRKKIEDQQLRQERGPRNKKGRNRR